MLGCWIWADGGRATDVFVASDDIEDGGGFVIEADVFFGIDDKG